MKRKEFLINSLLAFSITFLFFALYIIFFHPVFTLIDDNIMQEILSGTFTGTPDGHAIYIKYTLSFLLSRLYYINAAIPWYGLFLIFCEFVCFFLVLYRACSRVNKVYKKALLSLGFIVVFSACAFGGIVFFTYTSVAGLLGATAIFWFLTIDDTKNKLNIILNYSICLLLFLSGFSIRSNVIIMLTPLLLLALILKLTKKLFLRFCIVGSILIFAIITILGIEKLAYSTDEWKEYFEFNNARTLVYETKGILSFDDNIELFKEVGISKELHEIYKSYYFNFGNNVDHDALEKLSEIPKKNNLLVIPEKLRHYLFGESYLTSTLVFLTLYFFLLFLFIINKKRKMAIFIVLMLLFLLPPWIYMIFVKKVVLRVGVSTFYTGVMFLFALFINNIKLFKLNPSNLTKKIATIILLIIACSGVFIGFTKQIVSNKILFNKGLYYISSLEREELEKWCKSKPDNIYFITNNTYVDFGALINSDNLGFSNVTPLGLGWIAHSPLAIEKMKHFEIYNIERDILTSDNSFIITYHDYKMDSIVNYFKSVYPNFRFDVLETFKTPRGGEYDVIKMYIKED